MKIESGMVVQVISGNKSGSFYIVEKQTNNFETTFVYTVKNGITHFPTNMLKVIGMAGLVIPARYKNN